MTTLRYIAAKAALPNHRGTGWQSPTYKSWSAMHQRCLNPRSTKYPRYGGRGIKIYEPWLKFVNFLADMGERPEGTTLDRIDNDGNYEPSNCRWATPKVQARNSGHYNLVKTHCKHGHPYSGRNLHVKRNGARECLECARLRMQRYRARIEEKVAA